MKIEEDIYGEVIYKEKWLRTSQLMMWVVLPLSLLLYAFICIREKLSKIDFGEVDFDWRGKI